MTLVLPAVQSLISGDGSKSSVVSGGGGGRVNFTVDIDSQMDRAAVGIELNKAIGLLNTQIMALPTLGKIQKY